MIGVKQIIKKKTHSAIGKPHPKQQFTIEEDMKLQSLVNNFGDKNWDLIAKCMGNRNERQCKERWTKYLSPNINNSPWSEEEDRLLVTKIEEMGQKWVKISKFFNNRTDANLKNRWNVLVRRAKLYGGDMFAAINSYSSPSQDSISSLSASEESNIELSEQNSIDKKQNSEVNKQQQKPFIKALNDNDKSSDLFDNAFFNDFDFNPFGTFEEGVYF